MNNYYNDMFLFYIRGAKNLQATRSKFWSDSILHCTRKGWI